MTSVVLGLLWVNEILLAMADDRSAPTAIGAIRIQDLMWLLWSAASFSALGRKCSPQHTADLIRSRLLALYRVCIGVPPSQTRPECARPFPRSVAPFTCVLGAIVCGGMTISFKRRGGGCCSGPCGFAITHCTDTTQPAAQAMTQTLATTAAADGL